jgi:hypothetical protein
MNENVIHIFIDVALNRSFRNIDLKMINATNQKTLKYLQLNERYFRESSLLLLNSYSLKHRHKTTHVKVFIYLIRKKNLNEEEKSLVFNFIATKIVVDKSTIIRRNDVYAHFLLLSSTSNTKNRLRDKLNERVFELL